MSFNDVMDTILPPSYRNGRKYKPEISTDSNGILQDFYAPRKRNDQRGRGTTKNGIVTAAWI